MKKALYLSKSTALSISVKFSSTVNRSISSADYKTNRKIATTCCCCCCFYENEHTVWAFGEVKLNNKALL